MPTRNEVTNDDILKQGIESAADIRNICNTLEGIKAYISKQIEQQANTNSRLAVIERVQNDMISGMGVYQKGCDDDRKSLEKRVTDTEKRVTSTEGFQNRAIKAATMISGFMAFVTTIAVEAFKK